MNTEIQKLKKLFKEVKNKEFNKSLRKATTGIGYTFENLINKKEDNLSLPDFNGIEIKTKLGYTKSSLTLFCSTPKKDNTQCIKYLLETFGYPNKNLKYKSFRIDVYTNKNNILANRYIFKLKIDYQEYKLKLLILDIDFNIIDNTIYWILKDIETRLYTKLNYLAYITGYPYNKNNETYYKYTNLKIYKLKNFNKFIELLETNKIYITFNIGYFRTGKRVGEIHDRGTAFKLKLDNLTDLFYLIDKA